MTAEQLAADVREIADVVVDAADYDKLHKAADLIERQAAEIARLREALTVIRGSGKVGTWTAVTEPLVGRFDVASKFGGDAVHNAEGSMAMAELLRAMASKLDNACVAARQALGDHNG